MSRKHPPILRSLLLAPSLVLEAISVISVSAMKRYRAERRRSESISSFTPNSLRHQKILSAQDQDSTRRSAALPVVPFRCPGGERPGIVRPNFGQPALPVLHPAPNTAN